MMTDTSPALLRQNIRQYLTALNQSEREHLTDYAIKRFTGTAEFRRCRHIGLFYPVRHELNLLPLIDICWAMNKQVYLPSLLAKPFQKMIFHPFTANTSLKLNRFSIPEPDMAVRHRVNLRQMDIVITPLLAFGHQGERLGMGGGFYDRTFAYLNRHSQYSRPRLWAIALNAQQSDLQANPWDVPLQAVVTESTIHRFKS